MGVKEWRLAKWGWAKSANPAIKLANQVQTNKMHSNLHIIRFDHMYINKIYIASVVAVICINPFDDISQSDLKSCIIHLENL